MSKNQMTRRQHYIPQVYLGGFSPQYQNKGEKYTIYFYDLEKRKQSKKRNDDKVDGCGCPSALCKYDEKISGRW